MKLSFFILCLFVGNEVLAHARLRADGVVPPRNNNAGLKTGPCGGVARTNTNTELVAGSTITLTWEETIQHPGYYQFAISPANDENFTIIKVVQDTQDNRNDLPHQYSTEITVPDIECDNCTLQLIQYMTENPNNPRLYFSCADIRIVAGATPPSGQMPDPVPPPIVVPNNPPVVEDTGQESEDSCH